MSLPLKSQIGGRGLRHRSERRHQPHLRALVGMIGCGRQAARGFLVGWICSTGLGVCGKRHRTREEPLSNPVATAYGGVRQELFQEVRASINRCVVALLIEGVGPRIVVRPVFLESWSL